MGSTLRQLESVSVVAQLNCVWKFPVEDWWSACLELSLAEQSVQVRDYLWIPPVPGRGLRTSVGRDQSFLVRLSDHSLWHRLP